MIRTILVANRGEIARRIFRTCRELGITTVAVHSDADAGAPFAVEADLAVRLPGSSPTDTYLRGDLIIAAGLKAGADAIHPGYGFLSENAQFARDVVDAGLTWIGPAPETIDAMGSKIRAKELMAAGGVPVLSVDAGAATPGDFPLLVKASAGGGGRGMRVVTDPADLEGELAAAGAEALSAFGDATVFVEPYLPTARHIEVQVLADTHGTCWVVGDRDCSIQRRHQKVVEEAPAPAVSDPVRTTLHDAARAAVKAVDYVGAGTVEFLVADAHLDGGRVWFLEMNTRLQVEHPVTEEVFGVDLVAEQIRVAEGESLGREPNGPGGHAIEVRLYAEDPADEWQPQTGTVRTFDVPGGPGVRVDSGVEAGSVVGIHYDAMLAKIVAHGADRATALRKLGDTLRRTRVHGVRTNLDFLRSILADEEFAAASLHTALLDERLADWTKPGLDDRAVRLSALAAALAEATTTTAGAKVLSRIPTAYRNVPSQPRTRTYAGDIAVTYSAGFVQHDLDDVTVVDATPTRVVLEVDGITQTYEVAVGHGWVDVDGPHGSITLTPVPIFVDPADVVAEGSLLAPMPAAVISVAVADGQHVSKGDVVVVLEAMKMQHTITAPTDGVVSGLSVTPGSQVESGAVLAVIPRRRIMNNFTESDERLALRKAVADLGTKYGRDYFEQAAKEGRKTTELWEEAGKLGYLGVAVPEEFGGGGGDIGDLAAVCEELAAAGSPLLLMVVSPAIVGTIITQFGTQEQKERWLPGLADGTSTFAFSITEPDAGSNSHQIIDDGLPTEDDGWRLKGTKTYISGIDEAEPRAGRRAYGGRQDRQPQAGAVPGADRRRGVHLPADRHGHHLAGEAVHAVLRRHRCCRPTP